MGRQAQHAQVERLAPALAEAVSAEVRDTEPSTVTRRHANEPTGITLASWLELIAAIAENPGAVEAILASQAWREWDPPAHDDKVIADLLAQFDDDAAERAWSVVGPFVDADGYQAPAARSARELINNALTHDRFSPGDLAGLTALSEIVLRSAPEAREYAESARRPSLGEQPLGGPRSRHGGLGPGRSAGHERRAQMRKHGCAWPWLCSGHCVITSPGSNRTRRRFAGAT